MQAMAAIALRAALILSMSVAGTRLGPLSILISTLDSQGERRVGMWGSLSWTYLVFRRSSTVRWLGSPSHFNIPICSTYLYVVLDNDTDNYLGKFELLLGLIRTSTVPSVLSDHSYTSCIGINYALLLTFFPKSRKCSIRSWLGIRGIIPKKTEITCRLDSQHCASWTGAPSNR